ncbi:MAG: endonuclease/exonuclease/phosphatase family protein [Paludibacteraceae bacterium]|nr:endonuclease/exonuclease/phosphatase family protein [Paludibacteraceae bacterium]
MKLLLIVLQLTFMTYNVENLFDTRHDTLKNDTAFTPTGEKRWTESRLRTKIHNIMQVISAQDELPAIVGLCEIENDSILTRMTTNRYARLNYGFVHHESSDARGIDVALLYRKDLFTVDTSFTANIANAPRGMLYVRGHLRGNKIIHIMQVHAPSRLGGATTTTPLRRNVAMFVKYMADSIIAIDSTANILIMGDFNDTPSDAALYDVLKALPPTANPSCGSLYNLTWTLHEEGYGTYYFQGEWSMLDHIIVSGAMLNGLSGIKLPTSATIYCPNWLKESNGHPRRTYLGDFYQGGVSDHFPITVTSLR